MKTLSRHLIPEDFSYYRTGSKIFYDYYRQYTKLIIDRIGYGHQFMKAGKVFPNFYSIIVEKIDVAPSLERLRELGIKHGIIYWGPLRCREKPKGWIGLPSFFAKVFLHSSRSAFSILDRPDYWNKWSSKARGHRRKILSLKESGRLKVEQITSISEYLAIYKTIKVPDPYKDYIIQWCEKKAKQCVENLRIYMITIDGKVLAGAIFIDEDVTSEYFTSFYSRDAYEYHLGIAMMDAWFLDSYEKGIKYCDLDHMRDSGQSSSYAGYTKFKESIADYDVFFHDMWIKIF